MREKQTNMQQTIPQKKKLLALVRFIILATLWIYMQHNILIYSFLFGKPFYPYFTVDVFGSFVQYKETQIFAPTRIIACSIGMEKEWKIQRIFFWGSEMSTICDDK